MCARIALTCPSEQLLALDACGRTQSFLPKLFGLVREAFSKHFCLCEATALLHDGFLFVRASQIAVVSVSQ
jgi:hypothetical protein